MRTKIARWGNSLALRLPRKLAAGSALAEGSAVDVFEKDSGIFIRPVSAPPKLEDLLAGIRPENLHEGVETGDPQGGETW